MSKQYDVTNTLMICIFITGFVFGAIFLIFLLHHSSYSHCFSNTVGRQGKYKITHRKMRVVRIHFAVVITEDASDAMTIPQGRRPGH